MDSTILTAMITGICTLSVCLINNYFQAKRMSLDHQKVWDEMSASQQQSIALIEYKIDELSKHVDKHNQVIDRTYKLEQTVSLLLEKLAVVNHRIDDLESKED